MKLDKRLIKKFMIVGILAAHIPSAPSATVIAGSFFVPGNASRMVNRLKDMGHNATVTDNGGLQTVSINGLFRAKANSICRSLKRSGIDCFVNGGASRKKFVNKSTKTSEHPKIPLNSGMNSNVSGANRGIVLPPVDKSPVNTLDGNKPKFEGEKYPAYGPSPKFDL